MSAIDKSNLLAQIKTKGVVVLVDVVAIEKPGSSRCSFGIIHSLNFDQTLQLISICLHMFPEHLIYLVPGLVLRFPR